MPDTQSTTTTPAPALIDPNGKTWHPTEHDRPERGGTLYVIDGADPAKVSPVFMSSRTELESIFGTELHPIVPAADDTATGGEGA